MKFKSYDYYLIIIINIYDLFIRKILVNNDFRSNLTTIK